MNAANQRLGYNEYKYAVYPGQLSTVLDVLQSLYGNSDSFASGIVDSIYYDGDDMQSYYQCLNGESQKRKIRIRGYGQDFNQIHIKSKDIFGVLKAKAKIVPVTIKDGIAPDLSKLEPKDGEQDKFEKISTLIARVNQPKPVIRVKYERFRYRMYDYRVTLDTNIQVQGMSPLLGIEGAQAVLPHHVLEVKTYQPRPYLPLLGILKLNQVSFSKFFLGINELSGAPV